jgi:catechol 2,3-dioxygenase-like lactoylglutathione lyase family enzyme
MSQNTPHVGAIQCVTVGVSDMQSALALFRDAMKMVEERRYTISPSLRDAWNLPAAATGQIVELSRAGYPMGRLRLAQFDGVPSVTVRSVAEDSGADIGPKAIDFYVRDPISHAMSIYEGLGYKYRAKPVKHQVGDVVSEELVFFGPDEIPILLMVGHVHPDTDLRSSWTEGDFSEIATVSISSGDLAETRRFYVDTLGLTQGMDKESGDDHREGVAKLTGTPQGGRINFSMFFEAGEPSGKILVLHFFGSPSKRLTGRMKPGNLGFSLLTHRVSDIAALHDRVVAAGYAVPTPPTTVDIDGEERRMMLVIGPNEEMLELVEA